MSSVGRVVDIETMVVNGLLADTALAVLVSTRVSTDLPTTFPDGQRVALHRSGGTAVDDGTERLDRPVLQVEAFGATKAEAFDVAQEAMAAMLRLEGTAAAQGFISGVSRLSGPVWSPDPDTFTPRYLLSVALVCHV